MIWTRKTWTMLAALSGFLAVGFGAFGAHDVTDPAARDWLKTGSTYEFIHALATLACSALVVAGAPRARHAPALFLGGSLLFSGSLYAMALGAPHILGAVTPVGGLMFLAGWLALAWSARDIR
ncbi:DUF423 domain-containing protein [Caulobacter sp. KR2-114]|uniref:DUF423 domain-containing protein n=1 Tax=Caulobacter sp. KR2-114 TaxID=3400912 RepID=UPI003C0F12AE